VAAKKFFRKLLKGLRYVPRAIVTDKLASYEAAHREILHSVEHRRSKYLNNRAENSHQPTRARACDETIQIYAARPTVPVGIQRHLGALPAPAASAVGGRLSARDGTAIRGLA
jgi:DDE domain